MRRLLPFLLASSLVGAARAQTSFPMITHLDPVAVERGQTSIVVVSGQQNFSQTYKALIEGTGIAAEVVKAKVPPALERSATLKLAVEQDAALGVREVRLASRLGVSSVGQLVVSDHVVVLEKGDNNDLAKAQAIPVPCTVAGKIEIAEDVDHFRFKAKAGQTLSFEVRCARLQDKIHDLQKHADPILTLFDQGGKELAANDDFYFADPLLAYTFKKDGEYVVAVRDSKYDGDPRWVYALLVTDRPYASHVYPSAAQAGKTIALEPVGSAALCKPRIELTAPTLLGLRDVTLDTGAGRVPPVPLIVCHLPQFNEIEPNDDKGSATRVTLPCGINGRIGARRDVDHFAFKAVKGKPIRFEVKARRFGTPLCSSLDSVIDVLNAKGSVLATNDDSPGLGKDSMLLFSPPTDGEYLLRVADLHGKGGPTFGYHVEADFARPDFVLKCDGDKAMIGPGSRTAWFVQLTRSNGFTGSVKIDVKGLPKGVSVNPLTIQPDQSQGLLVLSAAADATQTAGFVEVSGTATLSRDGKDQTVARAATTMQEIYFPGGGRGTFDVNTCAVGVTDHSDVLEVNAAPIEVVLRPGGEAKLDVAIKRKAGFDKGVTLDVMLRHLGRVFGNTLPPGVSVVEGKSKTLLGTGDKGHITLRAEPGAASVEGVPISVQAYVSVNFVVKVGYSSQPIPLSVRK